MDEQRAVTMLNEPHTGTVFTSKLPVDYRDDLEKLLFFNAQQDRVKAGIVESVEKYGVPRIIADGEQLRVSVGKWGEVQTLFALAWHDMRWSLIGVMIYAREDHENLVLLHIGVSEDYASAGANADQMLLLRFICTLRDVARSIRGIRSVKIIYGKQSRLEIGTQPRTHKNLQHQLSNAAYSVKSASRDADSFVGPPVLNLEY
jgi:hypothetical protein